MAQAPGLRLGRSDSGSLTIEATCNELSPKSNHRCSLPPSHVKLGHDHVYAQHGVAVTTWPLELDEASRLATELEQWWGERAEDEIMRTVPKAIEYGSGDLIEIGRDLASLMGREVNDQDAAELGIYFYIRGKMARWADAIRRGAPISDDTLFDLGVYTRMAQRVRSHGGWPGVKESAQ